MAGKFHNRRSEWRHLYLLMSLGKRKEHPEEVMQEEKKFKPTTSKDEEEAEEENEVDHADANPSTEGSPQTDEEEDAEEEEEDLAKFYLVTSEPEKALHNIWAIDDNNDHIQPFFATNKIAISDRTKWPTFKEFQQAVKLAEKLEKILEGVLKVSMGKTKWCGFVLTRAFEDQEAQQAFEEALGLPESVLDAEAGLYYEDLEDDDMMFVDGEERVEYSKAEVTKMKKATELILDELDDHFSVGFCSERAQCAFPEFWGGSTSEGVLVGVFATVKPSPIGGE